MHRHWMSAVAAAALLVGPTLASAQTAATTARAHRQAKSREAYASSSTLNEHIERANKLVNELLSWQPVTTNERQSATAVALSRDQVQQVKHEVDAMQQAIAPTANRQTQTGTLAAHVRRARQIADQLLEQPAGRHAVGTSGTRAAAKSTKPVSGTSSVVTVDRTKLEALRTEIEQIRNLASGKARS